MKRDLYYQMDTGRPGVPSTYRWPSDMLAARRIVKRDLGVLGWTRRNLGGVERDVYLPLRIGQRAAPAQNAAYELSLFPTAPLKEVFLTVVHVSDAGRPIGRPVRDGTPLGYGYYPADRPIRIPLEKLGPQGIYYVEIGAQLESGTTVTLAHWFYHAREASAR
jgi:hypothetical protein